MKRTFDVLLAAIGLLMSSPVWVLIALAVKLEDGGPVLIAQERIGRGEATFRTPKFRTMRPGVEKLPPQQAVVDDPRITRVGRVLRATALDELPQLYSILRGDMSFVGPRPLVRSDLVANPTAVTAALRAIRHSVRPGLTGLSQIYAARDIAPARKFRIDALYVRKVTFGRDACLVALSVWISLRGRWESRARKL